MLSELPGELASAVEGELALVDSRELRRRAKRLSDRYRAHQAAGRARFVRDGFDVLAYAALILPAAHAQLLAAFSTIPPRVGDWQPRRMLDLGAGPGTAAWAACATWPSLEEIRCCEMEPQFANLGRRLAQASRQAAVRDASWRLGDLLEEGLPGGKFDLVVLSLVLSELEPRERARLVGKAHGACSGVLVVVEPGTPATFDVVRHARAQLLGLGRATIAPCPHDEACPLVDDWCHFSERHERPAFQRRAREASLPWEDAKFAFAAMARVPSESPPWARVRRHPWRAKGRVGLSLCAAEGLTNLTVPKSRRAAYKLAKKLEWGSPVEARQDLEEPAAGD